LTGWWRKWIPVIEFSWSTKQMGKSHNGHTETPDVSHVKNVDVTHEVDDVNVRGVLGFILALTVMTIAVYVGMWLLFKYYNAREEAQQNQFMPGPMAMTEKERLPPEPRLQTAPGFGLKLENGQTIPLEKREPQAEYQELRKQWDEALRGELKDQSGRVVGESIEKAIEAIAAGNAIPTKSPPGGSAKLDDYGISLPTAASSGRVAEKLR